MSTRKEKIPIVRFRAFSEPWFQNQLSEVAEFSKGRGYSKKAIQPQGTPIILYGRLYTKYESVISNIDTYANMEKNSVISEGGEVIIPASGESAAEISRASCVTDGGVILGGDINIVKPHENLDPSFIAITLSNGSQQRELSKRAQGKSVVHLHNSDLKAVKLFYPSYEEQSAIGSLFRTLDDLLASYKDNLANYQSLKVTMLSKMFPKAGETVPKIRLDGFEGEWEVVNLGTLIENYDEIISGVSGFPIATSSRKGLYLQNDYFEGGRTGIDLTLDFHRVPMGYVTYRHMSDDSIFKFNKNNFETDVLVSKEYPVFMSNDSSDIDFILYHLNNSRLFLRFSTMQKLGGTRVRLYYKNLITYKLAVPTIKEQQAIGSYFSNLDNLINSHQEKISQLETLKKKLLQDMFI